MMKYKHTLFLLGLLMAPFMALAQTLDVPVVSKSSVPFQSLYIPTTVVAEDEMLNETIVDMVKVFTVDSTYTRKTETHRSLFFPIIRAFGVRWKTIRYTREKLVGTIYGQHIPGKDAELFTEYDVNYDLVPHLPEYRQLAHEAYLAQQKMFKSRKRTKGRENEPPFTSPQKNNAYKAYKIHCEVTPDKPSRNSLNRLFYPTVSPMNLGKHPNFLDDHPTVGLYGCYILDCNHTCHPEIHPYEWFWWYDVRPETAQKLNERTWFFALFRDVSNRFKHWSSSPRIGQIRLPFVMPAAAKGKTITIEHLVFDDFVPEGMSQMDIPQDAFDARTYEQRIILNSEADIYPELTLRFNHALQTDAYRWWIEDIAYDDATGMLSGYVVLAMSVKDVYSAKLTTSYSSGADRK